MEDTKVHSKRAPFFDRQLRLLKQEYVWYLFLAPTIITIVLMTYVPLVKTLSLSMFTSRNGTYENFVGLLNYINILTDQHFWNALLNTLYIGLFVLLLNIPISFVLACMINSLKYCKNLYKSLYFLPNVTSVVAITIIFRYMFHPSAAGTINYFLGSFGLGPYGWLNDPAMSKWVVIIMAVWHGVGYNIIIWLAGLQSIPQEMYEAATVDGANMLQKWRYITIPLSRPIFVFMLIMGTMDALRRFSDVWTLGGSTGSPLRSLQTIVTYFYDKGMLAGQYGVGAAAAVIIFVLIMTITSLNLVVTNKKDA